MDKKQMENRKRELTPELLNEWGQLYCIVHDNELVMYRRRTNAGKIIRYLDFKDKAPV